MVVTKAVKAGTIPLCLVETIWSEKNYLNFNGVGLPWYMPWLLSLRSSYDWMISLTRVPSSFLNFIDLLYFRLYTFCVPQFFLLFFFAKSFFFFFDDEEISLRSLIKETKREKVECHFP